MGRRGCWRRSAISSPGCVTSLPTALTPARSWKPLLPGSGSGRLRSSSDRTRPKVLRYCHGAGWSSEPSAGLVVTGGWRRISKRPLPAAKRGFIWLLFSYWHAGSRERLQLIDISPRQVQLFRFLARHSELENARQAAIIALNIPSGRRLGSGICGKFTKTQVPQEQIDPIESTYKARQPPPTRIDYVKEANGTWTIANYPPCP
jgi:hypothetical protein